MERFSAVDMAPGWKGCRDSHLALLRNNYKDGEPFMVLEDDVLFHDSTAYIIADALNDLPETWDMLYLGCSPKEPQEIFSRYLFRVSKAHTTHAIIWNPRENGAVDYILEHADEIEKIDDYFATVIQPKFQCFLVYPMLAMQVDKFPSDIAKHSDVSTIWKNYKTFVR